MKPSILEPGVQHYAWGDRSYIPALLGWDHPQEKPCAELWMGAHPDLPSRIDSVPLNELVASSPEEILGPEVTRAFEGRLPYLFKVLCAARPLSIQAHPDEARAREGFAREEAAGIPVEAERRSYRDWHGKPELIVALTDFYALCGFRPLEEVAAVLEEVPELIRFASDFELTSDSLRSLYGKLMTLPQEEVDSILEPILQRLKGRTFERHEREFWIVRCADTFSRDRHHDRGLFSTLLLNLVHLRPEQALYLDAGTPHAYLEGAGIELMASSNNVVRGGLTRKHVDVSELLQIVRFEGSRPEVLTPLRESATESRYPTPAREFELRRVEIGIDRPHQNSSAHSADILFVVEAEGPVAVSSGEDVLTVGPGRAFLVPYGTHYEVSSPGRAVLYKATVPRARALFRGRRPRELRFGTSGLRGLVSDITDLETYVNTRGFLSYLLERGDIHKGDPVSIAGDLRPSTDRILAAVTRAVEDAGLRAENLGKIPTPALLLSATERGRASVMVTGSHIPFDRNGIKFGKSTGEVLKAEEAAILKAVGRIRSLEYTSSALDSAFRDDGSFREGRSRTPPPAISDGRLTYLRRYLDFFPAAGLAGKRIVVFQHSAVGRDLLVQILTELGAEVFGRGRSETFVPIDTENVTEETLQELQQMAESAGGRIDAVVSTDGDGDRPLIVGFERNGRARFFGGDLVGIVTAEYLGADAVAVPVSATDAVDIWFGAKGVRPRRTKIGSPYVIEGMEALRAQGSARAIVGFEANGGFFTGSDIVREGKTLKALPTRDAVLPILAVLYASVERKCSLSELFSRLPPRFSKAGLLDRFPREAALAILERFSPTKGARARDELAGFFGPELGFGEIRDIDATDGLRIHFRNGDIAHIRPSGNAPQLRIYAVADTQSRADEIVELALREPHGLLRRLEAAVKT